MKIIWKALYLNFWISQILNGFSDLWLISKKGIENQREGRRKNINDLGRATVFYIYYSLKYSPFVAGPGWRCPQHASQLQHSGGTSPACTAVSWTLKRSNKNMPATGSRSALAAAGLVVCTSRLCVFVWVWGLFGLVSIICICHILCFFCGKYSIFMLWPSFEKWELLVMWCDIRELYKRIPVYLGRISITHLDVGCPSSLSLSVFFPCSFG